MDVPISSAIGLVAARAVLTDELLASVEARGAELRAGLTEVRVQAPEWIRDVRGIGLMNAVEVTNAKGNPTTELRRLLTAMRACGLLLYPGSPHNPDDHRAHVLMVAPPLVVTQEEVEELVRRFCAGLHEYVRGIDSPNSEREASS